MTLISTENKTCSAYTTTKRKLQRPRAAESSMTSHPYYPHNLRRCTCPQFFALRTLPLGNNNVYGVTACIPQQ